MRLPKWKNNILESYVKKWGNFLDVGAYDGFMSNEILGLKQEYYWVDHNEIAVNKAKNNGIKVECIDITSTSLPFKEDYFNTLYCSHVLEHLDTKKQSFLFWEFNTVLKKDWILILFMPTWYHWTFSDDETHIHPLNHVSLASMANHFWFEVIQCRYSLARNFPDSWQGKLRLPPIPWYFTEIFLIAKKKENIINNDYQKIY